MSAVAVASFDQESKSSLGEVCGQPSGEATVCVLGSVILNFTGRVGDRPHGEATVCILRSAYPKFTRQI